MVVTSSASFIKLIGRPKSPVFRIKKNSPCVVSRADNTLFMGNNNNWVDSIISAKVATFSEMFEIVKGLDNSNELIFLFVKV